MSLLCVCLCACVWERQRQMWNIAAVNYCCHENVNFFTFLLELSCFRAHYESMVVCTYTTETCRITHTQSVSFHGSCPRAWVITELYDRAQDSLSSSQLIFPINICLCTEEQAAVQLMIRITAACCPTIPTACWEPNSLRGLRSVTHILPHSVLPIPTCISYRHSIGVTLSSNDRCLTPPFFSSVSLLSHSWIPSSSNLFFFFFFNHAPYCIPSGTPSSDTYTPMHTSPPPFPPSFRDVEWKDISFTTKVEMHPRRHLLLFCHGVNTNEEEMSPLLCPHLSQRPRDMHTYPCLSISTSLTLVSVALSSAVLVFSNRNI